MRVIAGTAKSHKLQSVKGTDTRPTTDRIKETLFNILAPDCLSASFLDLFSGTGAIGIEALSRGACFCAFADSSHSACSIIEKNLKFTKLYDKAKIIKSDALSAIKLLGLGNFSFDIIFMDPPYGKSSLLTDTLRAILEAGILADDGYIVIEQASEDALPNPPDFLIFKTKDFKTTKMLFIRKRL